MMSFLKHDGQCVYLAEKDSTAGRAKLINDFVVSNAWGSFTCALDRCRAPLLAPQRASRTSVSPSIASLPILSM